MTGQECGGTHRLGKSGRASLTLCQKQGGEAAGGQRQEACGQGAVLPQDITLQGQSFCGLIILSRLRRAAMLRSGVAK